MANRRIARADHLHAAIKPFLPNKIGGVLIHSTPRVPKANAIRPAILDRLSSGSKSCSLLTLGHRKAMLPQPIL